MMAAYIHAALALTAPFETRGPAKPKTPEQETRDVIRDVKLSLAVFHLQGALLSPTSEGSIDCFKHYLEIQTDMLKDNITAALSSSQSGSAT